MTEEVPLAHYSISIPAIRPRAACDRKVEVSLTPNVSQVTCTACLEIVKQWYNPAWVENMAEEAQVVEEASPRRYADDVTCIRIMREWHDASMRARRNAACND